MGGVSKRRTEEAIKRKQVTVIDCAEDYFKWAQEDISSKINYFLVSGNDFRNAKSQMDIWQQYRMPNIMNAHSIMVKDPTSMSETSPVIKAAVTMPTKSHFGEM